MSKIHVYQDRAGEWRWNLRARNGRIIACSGEGYVKRASMEHGLNRAIAELGKGDITIVEDKPEE
jgi:uncharacterized protein YegP (UPF0339 family)